MLPIFETYFSRFEAFPQRLSEPVSSDLEIIVVIPCFNEPDIETTLHSLQQCTSTNCSIETIIIVNHSEIEKETIKEFNRITFNKLQAFSKKYNTTKLKFLPIFAENLPKKHAGVGLARKIGMDEAIHRFAQIDNPNGIIVSCDADTMVEKNYLTEIENFYQKNPHCSVANIAFEHPLVGDLPHEQYKSIAEYELYLRYYVQQLKRINFPYAYHTIGSCFSLRAKAYCRQGGMNKRQAGEDFYFLQKLFQTEQVGEINTTKVFPSSRMSDRVPFGTGTVMAKMLTEQQDYVTYSSDSFNVLQGFFSHIPILRTTQDLRSAFQTFHPCLQEFLSFDEFEQKIIEIRNNSTSNELYLKRFFNWFNGFLVYKFLNHSTQTFPKIPITIAAAELTKSNTTDVFELLNLYRKLSTFDSRLSTIQSNQ